MKTNVLILIPSSYGGGAENLVLNQLEHYNQSLFNYDVISLRKGNIEASFQRYDNYFSLDQKGRFSVKSLLKLNQFIKQKEINIIHSHLQEADLYAFLLSLINSKIKWISTRHAKDPFRKKIYFGTANKLMAMKNEKIIAVSNSVKNFINKYEFLPDSKLVIIYNGIDTKKFSPRIETKTNKVSEKKDFVIGIAGRLSPEKGHEILLKAVALLTSKIKHLKLLIIGAGPREEELKNLVSALKLNEVVVFTGHQGAMPKIYNSLDVLCLPSFSEGHPLAAIEAMSCGLPVVASKIDSNAEVISDGKNGLLFEVGNYQQLSDKLLKISKDPHLRARLGKNARKTVLEKYSLKKHLKNVENLYQQVNTCVE